MTIRINDVVYNLCRNCRKAACNGNDDLCFACGGGRYTPREVPMITDEEIDAMAAKFNADIERDEWDDLWDDRARSVGAVSSIW